MPDAPQISIRLLRPPAPVEAALDQVVDLHRRTFPAGVLSQLGRRFVQNYYQSVVHSPAGFLWIAEAGQRVIGYLVCTVDRHTFERENRAGTAKGAILLRVATFRMCPWSVLRALRKRRLSAGFTDQAELIAIAIAPEFRRAGIGRHLVHEWETVLRDHGLSSYLVYTDNEEGFQFYSKQNGVCLFSFKLAGATSAAFRMPVSVARPPAAGL